MSQRTRILVIDDEPQIRRFLRAGLDGEGYEILEAASGAEGLTQAAREKPDVVLLDLGLPDLDGVDVMRRLREWSNVPVIVVSVRADEADKIAALDAGADDYVTKPFGVGELLARIRAALRHRLQREGEEPVFVSGALRVDLARRKAYRDDAELKLSPREWDLLRELVRHAGKVVTHRQLLQAVWGPAHVHDTQYLRVYVGQLRQKVERDAAQPELILTEPGVGYRLIDAGG